MEFEQENKNITQVTGRQQIVFTNNGFNIRCNIIQKL